MSSTIVISENQESCLKPYSNDSWKNRIHEENCLTGMQKIPNHSISLIIGDLPYGQTSNRWDCLIDLDALWAEYKRVIKEDGVILFTAKGQFMLDVILSNRDWYRYEWVWDKNKGANFAHVRYRPLNVHEFILVFYEKVGTYHPRMTEGKPYKQKRLQQSVKGVADNMGRYTTVSNGKRYPKSIIRVEGMAQRHIIHPTQKPVSLYEYLIQTYTNPGDVVLDPCIGSGTCAIASENLHRDWVGFEIESEYIEKANQRIEEHRASRGVVDIE